MVLKKLSFDDEDCAALTDIDDDSVLADGMIPDSRIVELIDELEVGSHAVEDDNTASHEHEEISADFQKLH